MFTKQRHRRQTDSSLLPADRVTPAGAAPTRTCGARAADMEALRLPVLSVLSRKRNRRAFVLATEGILFFNIHKHHKKTVSDQFLASTTFSFFLVYFWQQPRWSRGVECVWAQPLLRCRDNLTYSVILFTMF